MLGVPGASYHFEFTRKRGHLVGRAQPEITCWSFIFLIRKSGETAVDQTTPGWLPPVRSYNPYWDRHGSTYGRPGWLSSRAAKYRLVR